MLKFIIHITQRPEQEYLMVSYLFSELKIPKENHNFNHHAVFILVAPSRYLGPGKQDLIILVFSWQSERIKQGLSRF
jgi:hypothetical protein